MYKAMDIANWFLQYNDYLSNYENEDTDLISNLKLQKLLYYAQGCYLAAYDKKLFDEDIVAWRHGPVIESIYRYFKEYGSKGIDKYDTVTIDSDTSSLLEDVYKVFGKYSAWGLRQMTHEETPWKSTKINDVIDTDIIKDYFKENYVTV